jgi:hypothetical protein
MRGHQHNTGICREWTHNQGHGDNAGNCGDNESDEETLESFHDQVDNLACKVDCTSPLIGEAGAVGKISYVAADSKISPQL